MELVLKRVSKAFVLPGDGGSFKLALPDLVIIGGELTYVLGHNGSGKSVLMSLIAGEITPDSGSISCEPSDVAIVRQRAELSLAMDLTIAENLLCHAPPGRGTGRRGRALSAAHLLAADRDLLERCDAACSSLSVGQRQRLAFIAVTAGLRRVLLLDEFLSAIDIETSSNLRARTSAYALDGRCVLAVSHDVDLALADAARILILKRGRLIADIRPDHSEWNVEYVLANLSSRM